jgi:hypothetical protein
MYGWQVRPCTNLHGMYRWIVVFPQGCVVLFPSFFVVIFGALCCDFLGGVLRTISWGFCWVSRMRTLCLFGWRLCPQISLESDSILWFFRVARVLALESRNLRFLLILSILSRFLSGRGYPGGNLAIPKVSLLSVE